MACANSLAIDQSKGNNKNSNDAFISEGRVNARLYSLLAGIVIDWSKLFMNPFKSCFVRGNTFNCRFQHNTKVISIKWISKVPILPQLFPQLSASTIIFFVRLNGLVRTMHFPFLVLWWPCFLGAINTTVLFSRKMFRMQAFFFTNWSHPQQCVLAVW